MRWDLSELEHLYGSLDANVDEQDVQHSAAVQVGDLKGEFYKELFTAKKIMSPEWNGRNIIVWVSLLFNIYSKVKHASATANVSFSFLFLKTHCLIQRYLTSTRDHLPL